MQQQQRGGNSIRRCASCSDTPVLNKLAAAVVRAAHMPCAFSSWWLQQLAWLPDGYIQQDLQMKLFV
jgi:hypothetical protein